MGRIGEFGCARGMGGGDTQRGKKGGSEAGCGGAGEVGSGDGVSGVYGGAAGGVGAGEGFVLGRTGEGTGDSVDLVAKGIL